MNAYGVSYKLDKNNIDFIIRVNKHIADGSYLLKRVKDLKHVGLMDGECCMKEKNSVGVRLFTVGLQDEVLGINLLH